MVDPVGDCGVWAGLTAGSEVKVSTTDPESGLFVKGEKERVFAYSFHTACDRNGFVLGAKVTAVCSTRNVELVRSLGFPSA